MGALDDELGGWKRGMRARVLDVVAQDDRAEVREAAARHLANVGLPLPGAARRTVKLLAVDQDGKVRAQLIKSVRELVKSAAPLEATQLLANWSISRSAPLRNLTADVLADEVRFVGLPEALESLATCDEPEIRRSAARAAAARARGGDAIYRTILMTITADEDADTANLARRLLSDLSLPLEG